jgi:hypothetical protein
MDNLSAWSDGTPSRHAFASDPSGFRLAEAFGNSLADSVSFRLPSGLKLGGSPLIRRWPLRHPVGPRSWHLYLHVGLRSWEEEESRCVSQSQGKC